MTSMNSLRKGDTEPHPRYRESRFFHSMDEWYYLTREGTVEGPFRNRVEAELNLEDYLKKVINTRT